VIFETAPVCIAKNAPNKEASIKLLDWWLSNEGQEIWYQQYPTIPSNLKTKTTNPIFEYEIKTVAEENYQLLTRFWEAVPNAILQPAVDELDRFMLDPSTLDQVLENIEKVAKEYWSAQK
jgi:multiple sugar transport system substrate-binding protein